MDTYTRLQVNELEIRYARASRFGLGDECDRLMHDIEALTRRRCTQCDEPAAITADGLCEACWNANH